MAMAPVPLVDRFWPKVDASGDCWEWTAAKTHDGYGFIGQSRRGSGKVYAHRFAYEQLVGPVPVGMQLDHLCRVRHCVNPDHLEPVTNRENARRGSKARRTHCTNGHPFSEANTYRSPQRGTRTCRQCRRDRRALGGAS